MDCSTLRNIGAGGLVTSVYFLSAPLDVFVCLFMFLPPPPALLMGMKVKEGMTEEYISWPWQPSPLACWIT